MIIDTTCSVIERKMKEAPNKLELTFRDSDFTVNMDTTNFTISTGGSGAIPVVFNGEVNFNGNVVFNKCVTFNGGVAGNLHWINSVPEKVVWTNSIPESVSKVSSEHIDISYGIGTLDSSEKDDHPQYSWEWHSHSIKA